MWKICVLGAVIASKWAAAGTLPPYQIDAEAGSASSSSPNFLVLGCLGGPFCSSYVDVTVPSVTVQGDGATLNVSSSAVLKYQFEIDGPQFGIAIPITIGGAAVASVVDAIASGGVFLGLFNSPATYIFQFSCNNSPNTSLCPQAGAFNLSEQVLSGYTYTLGLSVGGVVQGAARGNYSATVDPMITIDPSFANAGLYSLSISDGIGTASAAVPEPSSLLPLGAGLLGFMLLRRLRT
jgi:hypothetical protein